LNRGDIASFACSEGLKLLVKWPLVLWLPVSFRLSVLSLLIPLVFAYLQGRKALALLADTDERKKSRISSFVR